MIPIRLENGNILAPKRAESVDGDVVGDGFVELKPGDDEYAAFDQYMKSEQYKVLASVAGIQEPKASRNGG